MNPISVRHKEHTFFLIIFTLIIILTLTDIILDLKDGLSWSHITHEIGIVLLASCFIFYLIKLMRKKNIEINQTKITLLNLSNENKAIKENIKKLSGQLQEVIEQQLTTWLLSTSEKDVGKLILKGLNMKEIANLRNTSEATVRQQAMAIYRKANVNSRQEFIAFFLEDL